VRIDASVGETEATLSDLFQEERANPLAIERALRVVPDAGVGEEVGEVMPQAQL
jgi:fructose-specific phosphotransferase system IIC component